MRVRAFWAGARALACVSGVCGLVLRFLGAAVLSCFLRRLWGWVARFRRGWCRGLGFVVGPVRGTILVRVLVGLRVRLCR